MTDGHTLQAGDAVDTTLTFTLAAGEAAARVMLLLTRTDPHSDHPTVGRARCIVLEAQIDPPSAPDTPSAPAGVAAAPRERYRAQLHGSVPASICGGTYVPVFCVFCYRDGREPTGFEIDADQRFAVEVADDASAVDAGPSISAFS